MITLGIILLLIGFIAKIAILWSLGIVLLVVGVVLALLVWRTKRLVPSFVTHVSFNAVALAAVISQRAGH